MGSDQSAMKVSNTFRSRLPLIFVNALILILNSQKVEQRLVVVSYMERGEVNDLRHHTSSRHLQLNNPLNKKGTIWNLRN